MSHIYSFDNTSRGKNNPLKSQVYIAKYERYDVLNSTMFASFEYQDNFFFNVVCNFLGVLASKANKILNNNDLILHIRFAYYENLDNKYMTITENQDGLPSKDEKIRSE